MRADGFSNTRIAHAVGVHPCTVSTWFSEADVKADLARLQQHAGNSARRMLVAHAEEAALHLVNALSSPVLSMQTRAALAILDRVGITRGANSPPENAASPHNKQEDDLIAALRRARSPRR